MRIANAYDAFWFLREHPKFRFREAVLEEEVSRPLEKGERIRTVRDEWNKEARYRIREFRFTRSAMDDNLDIFYAKVDESGVVNDDQSLNVNVECWLEFGQVKYGVIDGKLVPIHYHDPDLDCGAPTFDEALVKLARKVRRKYGDIKTPAWQKKG